MDGETTRQTGTINVCGFDGVTPVGVSKPKHAIMIKKEHLQQFLQIREFAKVCTYERFRDFICKHPCANIFDEWEEEYLDFDWHNISCTIGFDYSGSPYLSSCFQYYEEEDDYGTCDYDMDCRSVYLKESRGE